MTLSTMETIFILINLHTINSLYFLLRLTVLLWKLFTGSISSHVLVLSMQNSPLLRILNPDELDIKSVMEKYTKVLNWKWFLCNPENFQEGRPKGILENSIFYHLICPIFVRMLETGMRPYTLLIVQTRVWRTLYPENGAKYQLFRIVICAIK